jgi:CRP/FNR family cyclic AMP-dependent transcriptional regulator
VPAPASTDNPLHADALVDLGLVRTMPRRTIVFQEGDVSDQIYGVLSGRLKVYLSDADGREIALDLLGPGQIFGEMSLDGQPRSASVMTLEPSRLVIVQKEAFTRYLAAHPAASFELLLTVIRRARNLTGLAGSLALVDVYGRIVRALSLYAQRDNERWLVPDRITHQEIASRAGTTREMAARMISDMRARGLIQPDTDGLLLNDALIEFAGTGSSR